MNSNRLEKYLEYVFPEPKDRQPTESEVDCIQRNRSWSEYFFDQGAGNRLKGVEGTLWAAYNGVTEMLDHRKIRQTADQRLASIWFGEAKDWGERYHAVRSLRFKMADELAEFMGPDAVADAVKIPLWRAGVHAERERSACRQH